MNIQTGAKISRKNVDGIGWLLTTYCASISNLKKEKNSEKNRPVLWR